MNRFTMLFSILCSFALVVTPFKMTASVLGNVMHHSEGVASFVTYVEDYYGKQAPEDIEGAIQKAALRMKIDGTYGVGLSKDTLDIPVQARRTMSVLYNFDPPMPRMYILVNQEWFEQIPEEERIFLFSLFFAREQLGMLAPDIETVGLKYAGSLLLATITGIGVMYKSSFLYNVMRKSFSLLNIYLDEHIPYLVSSCLLCVSATTLAHTLVLKKIRTRSMQAAADSHLCAITQYAVEQNSNDVALRAITRLKNAVDQESKSTTDQYSFVPYSTGFDKAIRFLETKGQQGH
jgi:hypothetical protein